MIIETRVREVIEETRSEAPEQKTSTDTADIEEHSGGRYSLRRGLSLMAASLAVASAAFTFAVFVARARLRPGAPARRLSLRRTAMLLLRWRPVTRGRRRQFARRSARAERRQRTLRTARTLR